MGASIATLSAADLFMTLPSLRGEKIKLFTYSQPRTGNEEFVSWYRQLLFAKNIYRVTNYNDPIPRIPLGYFGYGWFLFCLIYSTFGNRILFRAVQTHIEMPSAV